MRQAVQYVSAFEPLADGILQFTDMPADGGSATGADHESARLAGKST